MTRGATATWSAMLIPTSPRITPSVTGVITTTERHASTTLTPGTIASSGIDLSRMTTPHTSIPKVQTDLICMLTAKTIR